MAGVEGMRGAFDPATVVAKGFDFIPFTFGGKSVLPKRLSLEALSIKIGWRPMGLQVAQCKLYTERFPTDFRLMSMARIILPHRDSKPYVTPEGRLPCPMLSTSNSLKYLWKHPEDLVTCLRLHNLFKLRSFISFATPAFLPYICFI